MLNYPTVDQFAAQAVGVPGKIEMIWQPLYDWNIYPLAGIAQLLFFQVPQGAGFTAQPVAAAAPKSEADTIMTQPGQLPAPQAFWVDGTEICIDPGSTATANLFGNAVPTLFTVASAAASAIAIQDTNNIARTGLVTFNVMQKVQYEDQPIYRFPPRSAVRFDGALSTTSAAGNVGTVATQSVRNEGIGVRFVPGYGIKTSSNFNVKIAWPALITLAAPGSGFNARIGVILNGWLFRAAQ